LTASSGAETSVSRSDSGTTVLTASSGHLIVNQLTLRSILSRHAVKMILTAFKLLSRLLHKVFRRRNVSRVLIRVFFKSN